MILFVPSCEPDRHRTRDRGYGRAVLEGTFVVWLAPLYIDRTDAVLLFAVAAADYSSVQSRNRGLEYWRCSERGTG